jgi:GGDEF domain-containing protein
VTNRCGAVRAATAEAAILQLQAENDELKRTVRALEQALHETANGAQRLRSLIYQDSLTGLPNRRSLDDSFGRMFSTHTARGQFAVLFIDVDDFKQINDSIGHLAGDRLLRELAATLDGLIRADDVMSPPTRATDIGESTSDSVLSRLGGDEFVILLPEVKNRAVAGSVARRILERLEKPFQVERCDVSVTASIGIAIYPSDGYTAEVLMNNADAAMYEAKRKGKARFEYYYRREDGTRAVEAGDLSATA